MSQAGTHTVDRPATRAWRAWPALVAAVALMAARAVEPYLPGAQDYITSRGIIPAWEVWVAAGVAIVVAVALLAVPSLGTPVPDGVRRAVLVAGWTSCVLLLWAAVGIVFDAFRAFFWVTGVPAEEFALVDWPGFLTRTVAFVALIIQTRVMLVFGRASRDACRRCGRVAGRPPTVRHEWLAYVACGLAFLYPAVKYYWWLGGQFGRPAIYPESFPAMETALLAGGVLLSLALIRPWGRVFPRWVPFLAGRQVPRSIPIVAGWGLSVALILQGATTIFGALSHLLGGQPLPLDGSANSWVILTVYAGWSLFGLALLGATYAYQQRTRGACPACAAGSQPA